MAVCSQCGNDYDKSFTVTMDDQDYTFDCFECAIQELAPTCAHCGCRVIGHASPNPTAQSTVAPIARNTRGLPRSKTGHENAKEFQMSAHNPKKSGTAARRTERRKAATDAAQQAATKRNQPNEIAERALMQRQGKQMHKQSGK